MNKAIRRLVLFAAIFFSIWLPSSAQSKAAGYARVKIAGEHHGLISTHPLPVIQSRTRETRTLFIFHTDEFWLNLHHFLYVLGRAQNQERDAAREAVVNAPTDQNLGFKRLSAKEQQIWREAVASYAVGPSKKDVVFDNPMPAVTNALVGAGHSKSIRSEVDREIATILQRVAPIYRKGWWNKHLEANRKWKKSMEVLVARYGMSVFSFITKAYQLQWPTEGFPVHVSAYSNWAGAYSTTGNLLVVSSQSASLAGLYGLETVFHEGMHQWDDQVFEAMRAQAVKLNKFFPRGLTHSMIFYTAGEAVRQVVSSANKRSVGGRRTDTGETVYVPYAEKFGAWQRGMAHFKAPLEEIWQRYLDGHGTRDQAFASLIERTAVDPPKQ